MFARCSAIVTFLSFVLASTISIAEDPPRPPQPPVTNATLEEWSDERSVAYGLRDNAFLFEEETRILSRRVAAWQGAEVVLSLQVERVTKEMVVCDALRIGGSVTVRKEQEPAIDAQRTADGSIALRIGDVVPLEVARRLRGRDTLVVQGVVALSDYQPGGAMELAIAKGRAAAVVSRSHAGATRSSRREQLDEMLVTPHYPLGALDARADGVAVVSVTRDKVTLASSSGIPAIDQAVLASMKRIENNTHLFLGEHRYAFTILKP